MKMPLKVAFSLAILPFSILVDFARGNPIAAAAPMPPTPAVPHGAQPAPSCPPGFTLEERGCTRLRHVPPILKCPKRSVLQGRDCVGRDTVDGVEVCPEGFIEKHRKCRRTTNMQPELGCKNGFSLQTGGDCIKVTEDEVITRCPKGTRHTARGCIRVEKLDVQHSEYISTSPVHQPCIRLLRWTAVCPAGFEMRKNSCIKEESANAAPSCPSGFELQNDTCIRRTVLPPRVTCPKGHKQQDNGCVLFEKLNFEVVCPQGEYDGKKHCRRVQLQPATPSCPPGYSLQNGDCTRIQEEMPKLVCHKGFTFDGKQCVKEVTVTPEYNCPPGTTATKDKCITFVAEKPVLRCPDKYTLDSTGLCRISDKRPADFVCPKGYTADRQTGDCTRSATVKVTTLCERGELRKGECVQSQTTSPELSCPPGGALTPEGCVFIETIPPAQRCPREFKMDVHGKCVTTDVVQPEYVCPPGFTRSTNKKASCERFLSSPAALKCPAGYELSGKNCMKPTIVEAIASCPEGLLFHEGTCIPFRASSKKKL